MKMINDLTYKQVGDVLLPDLELPPTEPLGKWGKLRKKYLYENHRIRFEVMYEEGTLQEHLEEVDRTGDEMFSRLMEQMKAESGITEQLKARDPLKWVGLMNMTKAQVEEIILHDLIYV